MAYIIYLARNTINGKGYIGFTNDLSDRRTEHMCEAKRGSPFVFHKAIRKYGEGSFDWKVIYEGNDAQFVLKRMEPQFIRHMNTHYIDGHGYNMTYGGDGTIGFKFSDEQRRRMSMAHKGQKLSEATKRAISKAHRGRKNTAKHNMHIASANEKKWVVIKPDGTEVEVKGLKSFCQEEGLRYSGMVKVAYGEMKQHRGFRVRLREI